MPGSSRTTTDISSRLVPMCRSQMGCCIFPNRRLARARVFRLISCEDRSRKIAPSIGPATPILVPDMVYVLDDVENICKRQKHIMELVLAGHPSNNIVADLGISQLTVENHRNAIMNRSGCKSLPALARLALAAAPQADSTGRYP